MRNTKRTGIINVVDGKYNKFKVKYSNKKTFIPARERTLLSLYWPDWTGVVYMSASLN